MRFMFKVCYSPSPEACIVILRVGGIDRAMVMPVTMFLIYVTCPLVFLFFIYTSLFVFVM